jgi:hypothetical protein
MRYKSFKIKGSGDALSVDPQRLKSFKRKEPVAEWKLSQDLLLKGRMVYFK